MASHSVSQVDGIGEVSFSKTPRNRSIRITVSGQAVRVTMPRWTSMRTAREYLLQNRDWVLKQLAIQQRPAMYDGQKIGKLHHLTFEHVASAIEPASRVTATKLIIKLPAGLQASDEKAQTCARTAAIKALRREAQMLLPPRLKALAEKHGFTYKDVGIKQLKRRWGSCDSQRHIVLNLHLMQLPWEQIDYVLCHELTHTEHLNHGISFWHRLQQTTPRAKDIRTQLRRYQPEL